MKNQHNNANSGISFSFVIVQKVGTENTYYGMVKEVDGVVVKGTSQEEVIIKMNKAISAVNRAKKKVSVTNELIGKKPDFMVVREFEQNYQPC